MASVCVFVPDGVGVRNFVLGGLLNDLQEMGDVHVFHPFPQDILDIHADMPPDQNHLIGYVEGRAEKLLRVSVEYGNLYAMDTFSMRMRREVPVSGTRRRKTARRVARKLGSIASRGKVLRPLVKMYEKAAARNGAVEFYSKWFAEHRPDVIFCTHQRPETGSSVLAAVLAAKAMGIPTATFIFSWDNLTSKSRIAAPFDFYFVWSEHMGKELITHYPHVIPSQVRVVGTPQFDPYIDESLVLSRRDFFEKIGADESRPLICYSAGARETCPDEPLHLAILLDRIRSGAIKGRPQVLLRSAPVYDDPTRYEGVLKEYPEIIFEPPRWLKVGDDWLDVLPTREDVAFLANLIHHSDVNINVASTMTLDFAVRDRPVVNIAFDASDEPTFGVPMWDYYYRFDHYRPVVELGAARFARSRDELVEHLNDYLEDPSLDRDARRRLVELEIGCPIGESSQRVIEALREITRAHNQGAVAGR